MGHRANFIIIRQRQAKIYYSQFGATSIPFDLLSGTTSFLRYAESLEPREYLLDVTWCEGAVLVDCDQHVLLFFENTGNHEFPQYRQYTMLFIVQQWVGWEIYYAYQGIRDFEIYIGLPSQPYYPNSAIRTALDKEELARLVHQEFCYHNPDQCTDEVFKQALRVSLSRTPDTICSFIMQDEQIVDYITDLPWERLLFTGPVVLEMLYLLEPLKAALPFPDERVIKEGVLIDVTSRIIWLWWNNVQDERIIIAMKESWPGWRIERQYNGLPGHFIVSRRDPNPLLIPEDIVANWLKEKIQYFQDHDITLLMAVHIKQLENAGASIINLNPTAINSKRAILEKKQTF